MTHVPNPQPVLIETQLALIDQKVTQLLTQDNDHEARIRKLERMVWIATGFAAAIGSAVGSFIGQAGS